jgi:hypothetical protein
MSYYANANHIEQMLNALYGFRIEYKVDNFWIDHLTKRIYIDFHADFKDGDIEPREASYSLEDLKKFLIKNCPDHLENYGVIETYDMCEGEYWHERDIAWFYALDDLSKYPVEKFLNEKMK